MQEFRDAKIQQLRLAFFRHQNIRRFEVTMNYEVLMRVLNGRANRAKELESLSGT